MRLPTLVTRKGGIVLEPAEEVQKAFFTESVAALEEDPGFVRAVVEDGLTLWTLHGR